jgi:hypothetical protein
MAQSGKVTLSSAKAGTLGNGTIAVSATPFPLRDTTQYQVGPMGDYIQEVH